MPRQLVLPLPQSISLARDDFFVSASNRDALGRVEAWPHWPGGVLAIIGPAGAGKTHLAQVHAAQVRAQGAEISLWPDRRSPHLVVEDVDRLAGDAASEEALFHAFHRATSEKGSILFTARAPVAGWAVRLPDLRTRLNTVPTVDLPLPDDTLLQAVLLKLFADRQIAPDRAADVAAWLVPRMDRSLATAADIVAEIDAQSLAEKRRIDTRLAADILKARTEA